MLGILVIMAAVLPPHPTRESPPPGLEQRALAVGATAPVIALPDSTGGKWSLRGPAALVFYRGHW